MHLSFYIDYRSTAYCEMFMSKKLKWNPKSDHCTRFYILNGVWFAICDHDENVDREKLGPTLAPRRQPQAPGSLLYDQRASGDPELLRDRRVVRERSLTGSLPGRLLARSPNLLLRLTSVPSWT